MSTRWLSWVLLGLACGPSEALTGNDVDRQSAPGALANAPEIRLAWAFSARCPPVAGCTLAEQLDGVVEVKNLAYDKQVFVSFKDAADQWQRVAAKYLAPAADGNEAWEFHLPPGSEFALAVTQNGHTTWDNNHGANYRVQRYGTDALVVGRLVAGMNGTVQPGLASGWVFVVNAAYSKSISVVYTDDAWRTTRTAVAHYASTFPSGVEAWHFDAPLAANAREQDLQFATAWTVGASSGWDNDFGRNYRALNGQLVR